MKEFYLVVVKYRKRAGVFNINYEQGINTKNESYAKRIINKIVSKHNEKDYGVLVKHNGITTVVKNY